jgi:hypothetical protein
VTPVTLRERISVPPYPSSRCPWRHGSIQAGRPVARSNWDRYTPRVRIAWAVVCWLLGLTATLVVLAILNADVLFFVVWTVAIQSWLAIMLAANVRKTKGLMKATIWVGLVVVFHRARRTTSTPAELAVLRA